MKIAFIYEKKLNLTIIREKQIKMTQKPFFTLRQAKIGKRGDAAGGSESAPRGTRKHHKRVFPVIQQFLFQELPQRRS